MSSDADSDYDDDEYHGEDGSYNDMLNVFIMINAVLMMHCVDFNMGAHTVRDPRLKG